MATKTPSNIFESVPPMLRAPLPQYETTLPGFLGSYLFGSGVEFDMALGYLNGLLDHQARVSITEGQRESKVFRASVTEVKISERKAGDFLLGKKAILTLTNNKGEEEVITTDWLEYNSYDPQNEAFYVALTRTLVQLAEENIGKEFLVRKAYKDAETANGGDRVKYLADLILVRGQGGGKSDAKPSGGSRSRDRDEDDAPKSGYSAAEVSRLLDSSNKVADALEDLNGKAAKQVVSLVASVLNETDEDAQFALIEDELFDGKASKAEEKRIDVVLEASAGKQQAIALALLAAEELG